MANIRLPRQTVILLLIIISSNTFAQWNEDYDETYKFICADTLNIDNMLKEYMKYENFPKILISNERVYFSRVGFVKEILSITDSSYVHSNRELDSILQYWDKSYRFETYIDSTFPSSVDLCSVNTLIAFFSKINDDFLRVDLIPVTRELRFNYANINIYANAWISYLFYFKKNEIEKVFRHKVLK